MGYTQREVARKLGLTSRGRLSEWESGTRFPGIRNLIKLSLLYHTLIDELYLDLRQSIIEEFEGSSDESKILDSGNSPRSVKAILHRPP